MKERKEIPHADLRRCNHELLVRSFLTRAKSDSFQTIPPNTGKLKLTSPSAYSIRLTKWAPALSRSQFQGGTAFHPVSSKGGDNSPNCHQCALERPCQDMTVCQVSVGPHRPSSSDSHVPGGQAPMWSFETETYCLQLSLWTCFALNPDPQQSWGKERHHFFVDFKWKLSPRKRKEGHHWVLKVELGPDLQEASTRERVSLTATPAHSLACPLACGLELDGLLIDGLLDDLFPLVC